MAPMMRTGGWTLDYVMERAHFGRFIEEQAASGQKFSLFRLANILVDPDLGNVMIAT
jgi:hypothetical protein